MKHSLLIFISVCLISLVSCQKKQYAYFQNSAQTQYAHKTKKAAAVTNDIAETKSSEIALLSAPTESISASNAEAKVTETDASIVVEKAETTENKTTAPQTQVKKKMTFIQKVKAINQIKKLSKQLSKKSTTSANPKSADPDTLALISLIAGIAGLILLFASGLLGLLLGLGAIILGILSYKNTNKKGMAIVGTILGALTLLIFLIAVIFVAALIAAL